MAQATAEHAANTEPSSKEWYGLGVAGWVVWLVMFAMNFFGGMSVFSGVVALTGYFLFCTVGSYLWIRFLKFVLLKIGML